MARRKQLFVSRWGTPPANERWFEEYKLNGRNVGFLTPLKFKGVRGTFTFIQYRECDDRDDVIDVFVASGARTGQFKQFPASALQQVKRKSSSVRSKS